MPYQPSTGDALAVRIGRRQARRTDFAFFLRTAPDVFRKIAASDRSSRLFDRLNSLCITPGGRLGGTDPRSVDVFFGSRPFDAVDERQIVNGRVHARRRLRVETGAMLAYYRQDDDTVACYLYSAFTGEAGIPPHSFLLEHIRVTHLLTGEWKLRQHWRYFMAVMEVTSIDGRPSIWQRLLFRWLGLMKVRLIHEDGQIKGEPPLIRAMAGRWAARAAMALASIGFRALK